MAFWDTVLGRTKQVKPDLDRLFGLPSAAITLEAAAGFVPTGDAAVCFSSTEGEAFRNVVEDVRALLDARLPDPDGLGDDAPEAPPVDLRRDGYGYSWLVLRRPPDDVAALVNDLHAVNAGLEETGFGPQLLCSLIAFRDARDRALALVYLYKRGTFYPFAPLPGDKRDNALELQVKAALADDLRIETDLSRWFPVWRAPGM
ncbi:hypothetical protein GCM10023205_35450 [Yinghuangia aomiensis]|uniref:DUF4123 domain-containing protein n=1 Tax=Yinghuangia aomiensis TaxID=676205 RepID=A0ABP9HCC3_9ACTN